MTLQIKSHDGIVIYESENDSKNQYGHNFDWVGHDFGKVQMANAKLAGMHLDYSFIAPHSTFNNCDLEGVTYYNAYSELTIYKGCRLDDTEFSKTTLNGAVFDSCSLRMASFINAGLNGAIFNQCKFYERNDFSLACLYNAVFVMPESEIEKFIKSTNFTGAVLTGAKINDHSLELLIKTQTSIDETPTQQPETNMENITIITAAAYSQVKRDAARYNWIRQTENNTEIDGNIDVVKWEYHEGANDGHPLRMEELDSAIDAQIAKDKK